MNFKDIVYLNLRSISHGIVLALYMVYLKSCQHQGFLERMFVWVCRVSGLQGMVLSLLA